MANVPGIYWPLRTALAPEWACLGFFYLCGLAIVPGMVAAPAQEFGSTRRLRCLALPSTSFSAGSESAQDSPEHHQSGVLDHRGRAGGGAASRGRRRTAGAAGRVRAHSGGAWHLRSSTRSATCSSRRRLSRDFLPLASYANLDLYNYLVHTRHFQTLARRTSLGSVRERLLYASPAVFYLFAFFSVLFDVTLLRPRCRCSSPAPG